MKLTKADKIITTSIETESGAADAGEGGRGKEITGVGSGDTDTGTGDDTTDTGTGDDTTDLPETIVLEPVTPIVDGIFFTTGFNCFEHDEYGYPLSTRELLDACHNDYYVAYDAVNKIPAFVTYEITVNNAITYVERLDSYEFEADPLLSAVTQADADDYYASSYDRGHMQAWADTSVLADSLESNYYTNVSPMTADFNRGIWLDLENATRDFVIDNGVDLHITMGSIIGSTTIGDGVNVPDAFYRIISDQANQRVTAYLIYQDDDLTQPLDSFLVTIDTIELLSGLDFYPNVPLNVSIDIESQIYWQL